MARPRQHRDEDLLDAVRRALREHGNGAPVRVLARAAAVSPAVLYQRFGDKSGLVAAALASPAPDTDGLARHPGEDGAAHMHRMADIAFGHFEKGMRDAVLRWANPGAARSPDGRDAFVRAFVEVLAEDEHSRARAELLVAAAHDLALAVAVDGLDRGQAREKLRSRCALLSST